MEDFAEFYAEHAHRLTVQLFAYTGDLAMAQDLVQEAFTRAVPRWGAVRQYDDPLAWVRHVAFNLARSRWRHAQVVLRFAQRQREEYGYELEPGQTTFGEIGLFAGDYSYGYWDVPLAR